MSEKLEKWKLQNYQRNKIMKKNIIRFITWCWSLLWGCVDLDRHCESAVRAPLIPIDLVNCVIGSRQTHHCESVCAQEPGDIRCHMAMSKFQAGSYHMECKPSPPLWECALWECLPEPLLGNYYTQSRFWMCFTGQATSSLLARY